MKILIIGTWNQKKASEYIEQANELGKILALRYHTLVASPSSGIQGLVAKSYKQNRGICFIGYYPKIELMKKVGEEVLVKPDHAVLTEQTYPIRNIMQLEEAQGVIAITGGDGTLSEAIPAVNDYALPFSYYFGSSKILESHMTASPYFKEKIFSSTNIEDLVKHLEKNQIIENSDKTLN